MGDDEAAEESAKPQRRPRINSAGVFEVFASYIESPVIFDNVNALHELTNAKLATRSHKVFLKNMLKAGGESDRLAVSVATVKQSLSQVAAKNAAKWGWEAADRTRFVTEVAPKVSALLSRTGTFLRAKKPPAWFMKALDLESEPQEDSPKDGEAPGHEEPGGSPNPPAPPESSLDGQKWKCGWDRKTCSAYRMLASDKNATPEYTVDIREPVGGNEFQPVVAHWSDGFMYEVAAMPFALWKGMKEAPAKSSRSTSRVSFDIVRKPGHLVKIGTRTANGTRMSVLIAMGPSIVKPKELQVCQVEDESVAKTLAEQYASGSVPDVNYDFKNPDNDRVALRRQRDQIGARIAKAEALEKAAGTPPSPCPQNSTEDGGEMRSSIVKRPAAAARPPKKVSWAPEVAAKEVGEEDGEVTDDQEELEEEELEEEEEEEDEGEEDEEEEDEDEGKKEDDQPARAAPAAPVSASVAPAASAPVHAALPAKSAAEALPAKHAAKAQLQTRPMCAKSAAKAPSATRPPAKKQKTRVDSDTGSDDSFPPENVNMTLDRGLDGITFV